MKRKDLEDKLELVENRIELKELKKENTLLNKRVGKKLTLSQYLVGMGIVAYLGFCSIRIPLIESQMDSAVNKAVGSYVNSTNPMTNPGLNQLIVCNETTNPKETDSNLIHIIRKGHQGEYGDIEVKYDNGDLTVDNKDNPYNSFERFFLFKPIGTRVHFRIEYTDYKNDSNDGEKKYKIVKSTMLCQNECKFYIERKKCLGDVLKLSK